MSTETDAGNDAASTGGATSDAGALCHPLLDHGQDTGFDECSDGSKRRRSVVTCPDPESSATETCGGTPGCNSDADCTAEPLGYCANSRRITSYCGCFYGCMKDADCETGFVCECGVVTGTCVKATCTTAKDCAEGAACLRTRKASDANICHLADPGNGVVFSCQTPTDECSGDGDCKNGQVCRFVGDHRVCGEDFCPV